VTLYDYPGTQHAFFNDDRPEVYDGSAARSAWARTLELFRGRLG
jgi:carboxymethylenebutenolidase